MIRRTFRSLAGAVALAVLAGLPTTAAAQQPLAVTSSVNGSTITLSWAPVGGADTYLVQAGVSPGAYPLTLPATATGFSVNAPGPGTFYLRVLAGSGATLIAAAPEFTVTVGATLQPPGTPVSPEAYTYCGGVLLRWAPGAGAATGYQVTVNGPGLAAVIPTAATQVYAASAPAGAYTFSVAAVGAGGASAPTATVPFTVGGGGTTSVPAPVISKSIFGSYVNLSWGGVPGATGYSLQGVQNGNVVLQQNVPASVTSLKSNLPLGSYGLRVVANVSCGQSVPADTTFTLDATTAKLQPRTPDPAPGAALPLPSYGRDVVLDFANRYAGELRNSCRENGGNNAWLFRVVAELRKRDKRWGLNWKRGNFGDMSQDIVTYNWSADPDEGTFNTRVVDVVGGHCGPNPSGNWQEQTVLGSRGAVWTLIPFIEAGYTP